MKRDAQSTRRRILAAAAELLEEQGYAALGANALAARAGVGKPLIYRYFGGMEGVAKALAASAKVQPPELRPDDPDQGVNGLFHDLIAYGRALGQDRLSRDMLVWALASSGAPRIGPMDPHDPSFAPTDNHRKAQESVDRDVLFALMSAGAVFLLSWRDRHDDWAGVPLKSATDLARLENVMAEIIRAVE